jgi:hypothetical protein
MRGAVSIVLMVVGAGMAVADAPSIEDLDGWLERLDHTAALYRERALGFTCEETIRWEKRGDSGRQKFGYVVVYDDESGFDDYRTRLKRSKRNAPPRRVEPEDYRVPAYLRSVYLWIFVFREERRPFHRYEIVGEDELYDRPAVLIRFEPLPPFRPRVNGWFGTAWVDRETAQLLKVEAHRSEDHLTLMEIERHRAGEAVSSWVYNVEKVTTEFGIEAKGMRFPSRVELRRDRHDLLRGLDDWRYKTSNVLLVDQTYTAYRFFGAEAESRID